ncbi:MAG TPA: energy transducer TonB [Polyangia bacterium]|nr:energy transducer TonB [Polyangia bacterium]
MAFEAFLTQGAARPAGRRRLTYALSIAAHAALLSVGVVYSFWHVEELSPPTVKVTFLSALPPPPPPPPPAGGDGAQSKPKKATPKPKVTPPLLQPKPTLVQPKETPKIVEEKKPPKEDPKKSDDDDDAALPGGVVGGTQGGVAGGTQSGVAGGTVGGTPGGAVDAPMVPKLLAPNMGQQHKLSGEDPAFPAVLRRAGAVYVVMAKICVGKTGSVDSVTLMKKADPLLDANVDSAVRSWRYSPLLVGSAPAPFCYVARFEFKAD